MTKLTWHNANNQQKGKKEKKVEHPACVCWGEGGGGYKERGHNIEAKTMFRYWLPDVIPSTVSTLRHSFGLHVKNCSCESP
jgi:hypothetical protein